MRSGWLTFGVAALPTADVDESYVDLLACLLIEDTRAYGTTGFPCRFVADRNCHVLASVCVSEHFCYCRDCLHVVCCAHHDSDAALSGRNCPGGVYPRLPVLHELLQRSRTGAHTVGSAELPVYGAL